LGLRLRGLWIAGGSPVSAGQVFKAASGLLGGPLPRCVGVNNHSTGLQVAALLSAPTTTGGQGDPGHGSCTGVGLVAGNSSTSGQKDHSRRAYTLSGQRVLFKVFPHTEEGCLALSSAEPQGSESNSIGFCLFGCCTPMTSPEEWFSSIDLRDMYIHVPIHPGHRKYLVCLSGQTAGRQDSTGSRQLARLHRFRPGGVSGNVQGSGPHPGTVVDCELAEELFDPNTADFFYWHSPGLGGMVARPIAEQLVWIQSLLQSFHLGAALPVVAALAFTPLELLHLRPLQWWFSARHMDPLLHRWVRVQVTPRCTAFFRRWRDTMRISLPHGSFTPGGTGVAHESLASIASPPVGQGTVEASSEMGPFTMKAYACCWQRFTTWCSDTILDLGLCPLQDILRYLQCLFDILGRFNLVGVLGSHLCQPSSC
ncbi:hypothetical protein XENOCAPTIV_005069, partial [Xenoophorus captivus]